MRESVKSRSLLLASTLLVFILACQALRPGEEQSKPPKLDDLTTQTATKVEPTEPPNTAPPTPLPITLRVRMDDNLKNGEINIEVLEGDYQLAYGTTLRAGSKIWEEEQYLVFPVGLAIEVGPAGLTLMGKNYPEGTLLYVDKENHLMIVGETVSTGEALNCQNDDGEEKYIQFVSPFTSQGVTIDGQTTSEDEWANAFCMEMRLYEWGDIQNGEMLQARWWVQNDDQYIYFLVRVSKKIPVKGVAGAYFWPEYTGTWAHSDGYYINTTGFYQDHSNWDESNWHKDEDLNPPGSIDVEASVSEDNDFYWFEIRKALDSGDGYDWTLKQGQIIGNNPHDTLLFVIVMQEGDYFRNIQMEVGER